METGSGTSNDIRKKRQRGRPKKAITRSGTLVVRITPAERIIIEGKAKEAGLKPSQWFRQAARKAMVIPRFTKEELALLRMLSGIANNLNQLTKLAHSSGLTSLMVSCRELLGKIERLIIQLSRDDW